MMLIKSISAVVIVSAILAAGVSAFDPFSQSSFVCAEDEYLGFSDTDPDGLKCYHVEDIEDQAIRNFGESTYTLTLVYLPDGTYRWTNDPRCVDAVYSYNYWHTQGRSVFSLIDSPECRDTIY